MKNLTLKITSIAFIGIFLIIGNITQAQTETETEYKLDCFSIVVGKEASADGSVLFAHNEDTGIRLVNTYKVPAAKHNTDEFITLDNGGRLPQVSETYGYLWVNLPGIKVCDTYLNEEGVAIGSNGCPSKETDPEITDGGIVFWLRRIVAERAKTSREGVEIAGKLIDQFGYDGSGRTYTIADANEAWILSVVHGKHWIAQRVPDDQIVVIPNYYTIGEIDLSDKKNFLGSPDIIEYAEEKGWYDPIKDEKFHFALAYTKTGSLNHPSNIRRKWRGMSLVSGKEFDMMENFPFSITPEVKVSVKDLMSVLRDHNEGTDLDKSNLYSLGNPYDMNGPMIGARNTQYGAIAQLRSTMPSEIGSVLWLAQYRPDVQTFIPWYPAISKVSALYGQKDYKWALKNQLNPPESTFDRENDHAFWTFVKLVDHVDENYLDNNKIVKEVWSAREKSSLKTQKDLEAKITKIYLRNPNRAIDKLTKISNTSARKAFQIARKLSR